MALRERHNMAHKASKFRPKPGDVVLVRSDNKNAGNGLSRSSKKPTPERIM